MTITDFGHPACAREVGVVDAPCPGQIGFRIKAENDSNDFPPIGPFLVGVEQT